MLDLYVTYSFNVATLPALGNSETGLGGYQCYFHSLLFQHKHVLRRSLSQASAHETTWSELTTIGCCVCVLNRKFHLHGDILAYS